MTYEDVWDIAHAIGYHKGQLDPATELDAIRADTFAFSTFLATVPKDYLSAAINRHEQGFVEGQTT